MKLQHKNRLRTWIEVDKKVVYHNIADREMFGYYEIESRLLYFGLRSEAAEILNSQ